jgi:hypothetical protein
MKFGMVFPDQGSQSGMLEGYDVRRTAVLAVASRSQARYREADRGQATDELNRTVNTRPVMLAAGYASRGGARSAGGAGGLAGHSLVHRAGGRWGACLRTPAARAATCASVEGRSRPGAMAAVLGSTTGDKCHVRQAAQSEVVDR